MSRTVAVSASDARAVSGLGTIVLALIAAYFGVDPGVVLQNAQQSSGVEEQQVPYEESGTEAKARELVSSRARGYGRHVGRDLCRRRSNCEPPELVLFSEAVQTACGIGQTASGPFYCPSDRKSLHRSHVPIDELQRRFGAPGDFAQAYVIAHEVGHHVQTLLSISERTKRRAERVKRGRGRRLSVDRSYRRIVSRDYGRTTPSARVRSWKPAISKKVSMRRARSATIV